MKGIAILEISVRQLNKKVGHKTLKKFLKFAFVMV